VTAYLPAPSETLRQGDVVLAPATVLLAAEEAPDADHLPIPPGFVGERVHTPLWLRAGRLVPGTVAQTVFAPVLVLSHDCQLEKDFNEHVRRLVEDGVPLEEAVSEASADPSLDPFAVVAPLQPYSDIPQHRHVGIRAGDRIGYFALDALPGDGGDYAVDLGRACTVSVRLLPQSAKVASLAPASAAELRYKLAEAYAIRDLTVLAELEAMVGHRILRAAALPKSSKKSAVVLHLDNGDIIHLEVRRPRDELPEEVTRTAGGSREPAGP
jgi:hypothetical protein